MEEKIQRSILIDCSIILEKLPQEQQKQYAIPFIHNLIEGMVEDEEMNWEIFLIGYHDLNRNLIELGFSNFAIEEISHRITFFSLGDKIANQGFNQSIWKNIDNVVYEIEPDIYQSFNFLRGLPSTKNIEHTFENVKTIIYLHELKHELMSQSFNIFKLKHFNLARSYKKLLDGVKSADLIIVPSESVKEELEKIGVDSQSNVEVFYPGINTEFTIDKGNYKEGEIESLMKVNNVKEEKYIFFDHNLRTDSEVEKLVSVLKAIFTTKKYQGRISKFLIVGKDFYKSLGADLQPRTEMGSKIYDRLKAEELLEYVVAAGIVEVDEFVKLLDSAKLYLHISEYNSFSFGPIQSISQGTLTFVDNKEILAPNMEKYVHVIDSNTPSKTARTIFEILDDEQKIKEWGRKAKKNSKKYSWQGAITRYLRELKQILDIEPS